VIWGVPKDGVVHYSLIFNSFVWLQVFNEINARKCMGEQNVFEGIHTNVIFAGVIFSTAILQALLVEFGGKFMQTAPLTGSQWGSCILIGAFSLPWGVLVRLIPIDNTVGQLELDPAEFEVLPFPDDPVEQDLAQQKSLRVEKDEADGEDGDKTPRGSKKKKKKSKSAKGGDE
jgi:hypothetical protein